MPWLELAVLFLGVAIAFAIRSNHYLKKLIDINSESFKHQLDLQLTQLQEMEKELIEIKKRQRFLPASMQVNLSQAEGPLSRPATSDKRL